MTAYSSTPDQTDDTPFITASGAHVRDGIVAANFLPIGAVIKIPELFGEKVFVVEDRMHRRFSDRVDIWMPDRESAKKFGIRQAEIVVL
ncbi:MAG: 3D domain-containing protein [Candidatus Harrisonbacteria bacterium]|nr:3D domain-containing protein [Candidatus Harrisonbacteria bacterium]